MSTSVGYVGGAGFQKISKLCITGVCCVVFNSDRCHMKLLLRWRSARLTGDSGTKRSRSTRLDWRKSWPLTCSWTVSAHVRSPQPERWVGCFVS